MPLRPSQRWLGQNLGGGGGIVDKAAHVLPELQRHPDEVHLIVQTRNPDVSGDEHPAHRVEVALLRGDDRRTARAGNVAVAAVAVAAVAALRRAELVAGAALGAAIATIVAIARELAAAARVVVEGVHLHWISSRLIQ